VNLITNAEHQRPLVLTVKGEVQSFARMEPQRVALRGRPGEPLAAEVRIVPRDEHPFEILGLAARRGGDLRFSISRQTLAGKQEYTVRIENLRQEKGRYADVVEVGTDSGIMPKLFIPVTGLIE
jgi:hypothetical protein